MVDRRQNRKVSEIAAKNTMAANKDAEDKKNQYNNSVNSYEQYLNTYQGTLNKSRKDLMDQGNEFKASTDRQLQQMDMQRQQFRDFYSQNLGHLRQLDMGYMQTLRAQQDYFSLQKQKLADLTNKEKKFQIDLATYQQEKLKKQQEESMQKGLAAELEKRNSIRSKNPYIMNLKKKSSILDTQNKPLLED